MRHLFIKTLTITALLFGIASFATAQGTSVKLVITKTNSEEQILSLSDQSQIHFENGESLVIDDGNGSTHTFLLSEIRKMICAETTGNQESTLSKLQLFPNPTHNGFIVNGLKGSSPARIYALDGRLMKSFEATEGTPVDLSELSSGMYLLHINGQTLKLMKL